LRWSSGATHASDPARPGERIDVPGAALVDAALRWADVVGQLSLTLDVRNVLDTRSYAPGNLGLTVFAQNPQDTRRAMLEASYRF
ncbi:MAG TPA: TonB-dependent receptor, partial [Aggregicoccus sp.]|nr:TonB-dependent receptor [Aggregicoccus sp.]